MTDASGAWPIPTESTEPAAAPSTPPADAPAIVNEPEALDALEPIDAEQAARDNAAWIRFGWLSAIGAYVIWGLVPIFYKQFTADDGSPIVPALEVLAHRVVWCLVLLLGLLAIRGQLRSFVHALTTRRTLSWLIPSTVVIAVNWFTFIYAVETSRIAESSLGYFITPLVQITLGLVVLGEKLRPMQWVAVGLAVLGVAVYVVGQGALPWIALTLAGSFGLYGLFRKKGHTETLVGLTVECTLVLPIALALLIWLAATGNGAFGTVSVKIDLLLIAAGAVTAAPLLLFGTGARRLPLTTIGQLQYIGPTMSFLVAILIYDEFAKTPPELLTMRWVAFGIVWLAVATYVMDARRAALRARAAKRAKPSPM